MPRGKGVVDLPDLSIKKMAWVLMLGKPAAEIEAVDLEGRTVKLADYRGKVVVLGFLVVEGDLQSQFLSQLSELRAAFKDQPVAFLVIHDASLTSLDRFKKAHEPIRKQVPGAIDPLLARSSTNRRERRNPSLVLPKRVPGHRGSL